MTESKILSIMDAEFVLIERELIGGIPPFVEGSSAILVPDITRDFSHFPCELSTAVLPPDIFNGPLKESDRRRKATAQRDSIIALPNSSKYCYQNSVLASLLNLRSFNDALNVHGISHASHKPNCLWCAVKALSRTQLSKAEAAVAKAEFESLFSRLLDNSVAEAFVINKPSCTHLFLSHLMAELLESEK